MINTNPVYKNYSSFLIQFFKLIIKLPIILLAIVFVIIIRISSPLIRIRLGSIGMERIGHFAINPELYLCKIDAGLEKIKTFDILFFQPSRPIYNQQLKKMWERTLPISIISHYTRFLSYAYKFNKMITGWEKHEIKFQEGWLSLKTYGDPNYLIDKYPKHLIFSKDEIDYAKSRLKEIGILEQPYICFQNREALYLENDFSHNDWNYHNYRDSNISNYLEAADELTKLGYYSVRVGRSAKDKLLLNNNKIIDYASNFREDILDIYLIANSRFVIFPHTGTKHVAMIFRVPIVCVNVICYTGIFYLQKQDICVPKLLRDKNKNRFLKFNEILCTEIACFTKSEQYEDYGIEVCENSPEEIRDAAIEMEQRLNNSWQPENGDEVLQNIFKELAMRIQLPDESLIKDIIPDGIKCKLSANFLRKHRNLL